MPEQTKQQQQQQQQQPSFLLSIYNLFGSADPHQAEPQAVANAEAFADTIDEEKDALLGSSATNTPTRYTTDDDNDDFDGNTGTEEDEEDEDEKNAPGDGGACWKWYANLLDQYPLLVKAITAFFILALGDAAAQGIDHLRGIIPATDGNFDWWRAIRFGAFGLLGAPWAHYYYLLMDKYLPPTERPFTTTTGLKLLIDQGIQAPLLLALIISSLAILKGVGLAGMKQDMQANYMHTLYANWIVWLPVNLINYAFILPPYRVLYVNIVFFFWTILLSILVNAPSTSTTTIDKNESLSLSVGASNG